MQTQRMSTLEAFANGIIGFAIATVLQILAFGFYEISLPTYQAAGVVSMFTGSSILRAYLIRRVFNGIEYTDSERIRSWVRKVG